MSCRHLKEILNLICFSILDGIGRWTAANGEGIYGSRPWKIFGENSKEAESFKPGQFDENYKFNSKDIRFTTKDGFLYAYCLGTPAKDIRIKSLGKNSKLSVSGCFGKNAWERC